MNEQNSDIQKNFYLQWLKNEQNKSQSKIKCPVKMNEYFLNLENPIKYLENDKTRDHQKEIESIVGSLKKQKEYAQKFSKNINKKVVTRENAEYKFDSEYNEKQQRAFEKFEFKQKRQKQKKEDNQKFNKRKKEFQKVFRHGRIETAEKVKMEEEPVTMNIVKTIDTTEFQNYKNLQLYDIFSSENEPIEKYIHGSKNISDDHDLERYCDKIKLQLIEDEAYFSEKSELILFNPNELKHWRGKIGSKKSRIEILSRCRNLSIKSPSFEDLLDYGSGKITSEFLDVMVEEKKKHERQQKLDKNNQNLEEQYNKAKNQLQFLKQFRLKNKNHTVSLQGINKNIATLNLLEDKSFDSYFEEDTKELLLKLDDLVEIRQTLMKETDENIKKISLVNMYHEMKNCCFKLLAMVFKNQSSLEYYEFYELQDKKIAERLMLETIYRDFDKFTHEQVDGVSKKQILKRYLMERQKNQRIMEIMEASNQK